MPKPPSKRPGKDLTKRSGSAPVAAPQNRPLAALDQALPKSVVDALAFGNHQTVRQIASQIGTYDVGPAGIRIAKHIRERHIWALESADRSDRVLEHILSAKLDRVTAAEMIGAMLDSYHAKGNDGVLLAMLDLIEGNDIARALESYEIERACDRSDERKDPFWRPIKATPASLAFACRKLIATVRGYPVPQPCDLGNAVRTVQNQLRWTQETCQTVVEFLQIADAVMLEFAPREQWFQPWESPRMQTALVRMLRLHEQYGDAREQLPGDALRKGLHGNYFEDADGNEVDGLTAFGESVKREQVHFREFMGPVEFKRITEQILAEDKVEQLTGYSIPGQVPPAQRIVEQIATETVEQAPAQCFGQLSEGDKPTVQRQRPKRIAAARRRSEVKRHGHKRKAHKEEQRRSLAPPVSDPLPDLGLRETREKEHIFVNRDGERVNRDGLTESDYEDRVGWGGYGIGDDGLVRPFSEDD